ncbi:MAG: flagellar hook-basal body complex protein FliE [Thermoanaerobacteraceae bacterium]|nr:flagellar hook-basal body complex protein FliE [Thermoanaerobacteraceae bacterium]
MKVDLTKPIPQVTKDLDTGKKTDRKQEGPSFAEQVKNALEVVNDLQVEADRITQQYFAGQVQDLHQVMIAAEKADLALQLTVQIRNKIIEAYKEISRMQI